MEGVETQHVHEVRMIDSLVKSLDAISIQFPKVSCAHNYCLQRQHHQEEWLQMSRYREYYVRCASHAGRAVSNHTIGVNTILLATFTMYTPEIVGVTKPVEE